MNLRIGGYNNYNDLLIKMMNGNKKEKKKDTENDFDFAKMGTIRNYAKQQKASNKYERRNVESDVKEPIVEYQFSFRGIDMTGKLDEYQVIIPISDEIKEKLDKLVREKFEQQGYVAKDNMELSEKDKKIKNEYLDSIKHEDTPKASWTMHRYKRAQTDKYVKQIRELDPDWDWGRKIKPEVLEQVFGNKLDVSI